jgi:hypothetical protein
MFSKISTRRMAGAALMLTLATNLVGARSASAQTLTATLSPAGSSSALQLSGESNATVAAGTLITIQGTSFEADESIGFWINVPAGTIISPDSLGQTDTEIVDGVIPLNAMASADDEGAFTYALDTSGLPSGSYSLVAHGLASKIEQVLNFTITDGPAVQLTVEGDTTVAAGTVLTIHGASYEADEAIGLWINVPEGTVISRDSLGQTDTEIVDGVIPLDAVGYADDDGAFTYTLDTSGLPSGSYSLVAHGLSSKKEQVLVFTIK